MNPHDACNGPVQTETLQHFNHPNIVTWNITKIVHNS